MDEKHGFVGATKKSLEEYKKGNIAEEELIPISAICGYSLTFVTGEYKSIPLLFHF